MSIVICDHCNCWVDSDDDPECFIENPYDSKDVTMLCEPCREAAWDRAQEDAASGECGLSLIEQQRAAYKLKHGLL